MKDLEEAISLMIPYVVLEKAASEEAGYAGMPSTLLTHPRWGSLTRFL